MPRFLSRLHGVPPLQDLLEKMCLFQSKPTAIVPDLIKVLNSQDDGKIRRWVMTAAGVVVPRPSSTSPVAPQVRLLPAVLDSWPGCLGHGRANVQHGRHGG